MRSTRVAVVTGTSRGIGLEIARQLLARGVRVIATSRDPIAGQKAADEIGAPFHVLDVSSNDSVEAFAQHLQKTEGGLDVLVNNAGIALDGFDAKVARRTLDVNFGGTVKT